MQAFPTPSTSAVAIGPLTIHFYALCIIVGVALAIWLGNKRFTAAFPETRGIVSDVAIIAVPFGVVGGRLYHVLTTPEKYLSGSSSPLEILKIWKGGLGIWGAISLGACGAYIAYKRISRDEELPSFLHFADAVAPGILFAQAIGRFGNWFNAELFGRPLDAPWALEIPYAARPAGFESFSTFHPTFAYEALAATILGFVLIWCGRRFPAGSIFALYVAGYCVFRFFIEGLRIDEAHSWAGLRLNQYVSVAIFIAAIASFIRLGAARR